MPGAAKEKARATGAALRTNWFAARISFEAALSIKHVLSSLYLGNLIPFKIRQTDARMARLTVASICGGCGITNTISIAIIIVIIIIIIIIRGRKLAKRQTKYNNFSKWTVSTRSNGACETWRLLPCLRQSRTLTTVSVSGR